MRWAIMLLLLAFVGAGLGLAFLADRQSAPQPAGAEPSMSLPVPLPSLPSLPSERTAPPAPSAPGTGPATEEARIEIGPDGGITISNIPDASGAARLVRDPDGGLLITNQPEAP